MTFYISKDRQSKKNYIIQCHSPNHFYIRVWLCVCVCVCVKTMKLTFMSLQIIFKVNTQIIPNDEGMYATNKTVSFYQVFNNLLTPISR